jgi:hypothetical protein
MAVPIRKLEASASERCLGRATSWKSADSRYCYLSDPTREQGGQYVRAFQRDQVSTVLHDIEASARDRLEHLMLVGERGNAVLSSEYY